MKRMYLLALALLLVVLAACGGGGNGDGSEAGDGGDAGDGAAAGSVTVVGTEFAFDPADVTVAAGASVTFKNDGSIDHEWVVLKAGTQIEAEADFSDGMVEVRLLATPGESVGGTINLAAGDYQVICALPGHFSAGMAGSLTVGG